jgi:hypothetical protein
MAPPYPTPKHLVEALHHRSGEARKELWERLRGPIGRLMGELIVRHGLSHDREMLTRHGLHAVETYLRTRQPAEFEGGAGSPSWAPV